MPPDLKARIELAAKESRRSLNAEIVARLEESLANHAAPAPADQEEGLRVLNSDGTVTTYTDDKIVRALVRALESVEGRPLRELLRERGEEGEGAE